MAVGSEFFREHISLFFDVVRKRWLLFVVPVVLASCLSFVAMKFAPTKYTASSLIMLQAANRASGGFGGGNQSNTFEQVQAVEAWLKSDQVLAELVPQMSNYEPPETPIESIVQMRLLAASLSLEVVGNAVLQIKMEGKSPKGLGHDLEVVLSRLMEGLTGPEQNILSAPQFVRLRRNEEVAAAEAALMRAIESTGVQAPAQIRAELQQLWAITYKSQSPGQAANADQLRRSINTDPQKLAELERLYAAYQKAADKQTAFQAQMGAPRSNYVSIFNSPDDLLIVGRPKDPIAGENAALKIAVAGMILSVGLGCGLVLLAELIWRTPRTRREFERVADLPVVARIGNIPGVTAVGSASG